MRCGPVRCFYIPVRSGSSLTTVGVRSRSSGAVSHICILEIYSVVKWRGCHVSLWEFWRLISCGEQTWHCYRKNSQLYLRWRTNSKEGAQSAIHSLPEMDSIKNIHLHIFRNLNFVVSVLICTSSVFCILALGSGQRLLYRLGQDRAGFRHVRTVRRNRAADFGGPPNSVVFHEVINISNVIEKQCTTICS